MNGNINNGATVSNPSPTQRKIVIANSAHSGKHIAFERHNVDGTPCIIGNASEHMSNDATLFVVVFHHAGGRTAAHPLPVRDLSLYEVHEGDFVGIMERDNAALYMDSYFVVNITDTHILAIHAIL